MGSAEALPFFCAVCCEKPSHAILCALWAMKSSQLADIYSKENWCYPVPEIRKLPPVLQNPPAGMPAGGVVICFQNQVPGILSDHSFSFFFLSSRQVPRPRTETTPVIMKKSMLLVSPVSGEGVGFCSGALNTSLMRPSPSTLS